MPAFGRLLSGPEGRDHLASEKGERFLLFLGRQAEAVHWNLVELAKALRLVAPAESLVPALRRWPDLVGEAVRRQALWRVGLKPAGADAEEALVRAFEVGLGESGLQPDAVERKS